MLISELEKELADIKSEHGDIKIVYQSLSHKWPPEPEVRGTDEKYVLLNP
jgi:hypothetical protein